MNQEILALRKDASELSSILKNGKVIRHGEPWLALPREMTSIRGEVSSVVFELIRLQDQVKPSFLKLAFQVIRPESLKMTFWPCLATFIYSFTQNWDFSFLVAMSSLFGALFLHISVNALNDVEDYLRLIDRPGSLRGNGVIQKGWMSAQQLKILGYLAMVLGILLGLPALWVHPTPVFGIGFAAVLGVYAYSSKPFELKYRALGEAALFVFLGPVLCIGYSLAVFGTFDSAVVLLGIFLGLISTSALHAKNIQEIHLEQKRHIKTLASVLGFKRARIFQAIILVVAFFALLLGGYLGVLPLSLFPLLLLSTPWIGRVLSQLFKASGPASALLNGVRLDAIRLYGILGVLLCLGLLVSPFLSRI